MKNKKELKTLLRFLEEFSWLMDSYSKIDFKNAASLIETATNEQSDAKDAVGNYESKNPNKHFLVGVLPALFLDSDLFKRNQDIADFSKSVLGIELIRFSRSSRADVIGRVICSTVELDDEKLDVLVRALAVLAGNKERTKQILRNKDDNDFNWNIVINELSSR
ncbi:hypothetical protein [Photobacterium nomapromontoriensis]|uniref:hypothetical protein n=1 Tax=Photobacterium nomapromontoriensis TaxID=2910237 RepID=UPI003D12E8AF